MLVDTGDPQNLFATIFGVLFVVVGVFFVANRAGIARLFSRVHSEMRGVGPRVARESKPWIAVMVGVGFVLMGLGLVALGLFARLDPPGTPR